MNAECEEIKLLLPWLVNESLEGAEKFRALSHLEACPGCRKELAFFTAFHKKVEASRRNEMDVGVTADLFAGIVGNINQESKERLRTQSIGLVNKIIGNPAPLAVIGTIAESIKDLCRPELQRLAEYMRPAASGMKLYMDLIKAAVEAGV